MRLSALVMMPGETIYRECPSCEKLLIERTLLSGNTIGARYWTDGKMDAPMFPHNPALVRCAHCQTLLWLPEAREHAFEMPPKMFETVNGALDPIAPTESDYLEAIESGLAPDKERETYCRIHAWHCFNDARRDQKNSAELSDLPDVTAANMKELFAMLDRIRPEERMLRAELARELGRFPEALGLLRLKFDFGEDYQATALRIRELAEQEKAGVAQVEVSS